MNCFAKTFTAFNGMAYGYHRVARVEADYRSASARVTVFSWLDEAAYLADKPPFASYYDAPLNAAMLDDAQGFVLQQPDFAGASTLGDPDGTLQAARDRRWAVIKGQREQAEGGGFTWNGSGFDSDAISQSRIQGAVLLATLASLNGQPFTIDWTLIDNSVRTLDGPAMIAVGQALGVHVATCHATARALRQQINAATTIDAVEGVQWPATP
jgi:hypothetical protein